MVAAPAAVIVIVLILTPLLRGGSQPKQPSLGLTPLVDSSSGSSSSSSRSGGGSGSSSSNSSSSGSDGYCKLVPPLLLLLPYVGCCSCDGGPGGVGEEGRAGQLLRVRHCQGARRGGPQVRATSLSAFSTCMYVCMCVY